jgi:hypothetical protein
MTADPFHLDRIPAVFRWPIETALGMSTLRRLYRRAQQGQQGFPDFFERRALRTLDIRLQANPPELSAIPARGRLSSRPIIHMAHWTDFCSSISCGVCGLMYGCSPTACWIAFRNSTNRVSLSIRSTKRGPRPGAAPASERLFGGCRAEERSWSFPRAKSDTPGRTDRSSTAPGRIHSSVSRAPLAPRSSLRRLTAATVGCSTRLVESIRGFERRCSAASC